jgi:hypothetical protein
VLGLWLAALWTVFVAGPTLDPSFLRTVVATCDEVLVERCVAVAGTASSDAERASADVRVVLHTDAELTSVTIAIARADGPIVSRELRLDPSATREERARAAGLVVAAQVLAMQYEVQPRQYASHVVAADTGARAAKPERGRLDLVGSFGTAIERGPGRIGLGVRGSWLPSAWPLGVAVGVRAAYRPDTPPMLWLGASLGLFARFAPSYTGLALEARLEAIGQHTEVWATDSASGRRERAGALRWGGQLGADVLIRLPGSLWLVVGVEGALLRPRVDFYVRGQRIGTEPLASAALLCGFRYAW